MAPLYIFFSKTWEQPEVVRFLSNDEAQEGVTWYEIKR